MAHTVRCTPEDFGLKRADWDEENWRLHVVLAATFFRRYHQEGEPDDGTMPYEPSFPRFVESYGDMLQIVKDITEAWVDAGGCDP